MSWDLGPPVAYAALSEGVPVLTSDGHELGQVGHVLATEDEDIFDGLVVHVRGRGHDVFADATQVDSLHERGVVLSVDRDAAARLPEPSANPAVLAADPDDTTPDGLGDKLRRAWDLISGNY